jgi:hypothetical protein
MWQTDILSIQVLEQWPLRSTVPFVEALEATLLWHIICILLIPPPAIEVEKVHRCFSRGLPHYRRKLLCLR